MRKIMQPSEIIPHPVTVMVDGEVYSGGIAFGPRATHVAVVQDLGGQPSFFWFADLAEALRAGDDERRRREAKGRVASSRIFEVDA